MTADFNGDGNLDLVVANYTDGTISVLLGNGDGTFQPQVVYPTQNPSSYLDLPYYIAVGDFNGDGIPDFVVANSASALNKLAVFIGNGDGTFQTPVLYGTGGSASAKDGTYSVAVGDFTGNGIADLVVTNFSDDSIGVLIGNGDGTFQSAVTSSTPSGTNPYNAIVWDFAGNGIADLVVTTFASEDGSNTYSVNSNPGRVKVGDFNGDDIPGLVVTNLNSSNVSILLGNSNGTFQSQIPVSTGTGSAPFAVVVGDFDRTGIPDLAVATD